MLCLSLGLTPLIALAPAAYASTQPVENDVVVSVKDIDFNRPEAVEVVYARLQYASKVACDTLEPGVPYREADDRACEREAVKGAVHDLNQPLLTALDTRVDAQQIAAKRRSR
jgi:UrcA family protein